MPSSAYHGQVASGIDAWIRRLLRDGRYAYGGWRKGIAEEAGRLVGTSDLEVLQQGLERLMVVLRKLERGSSEGHEARGLRRRCLDCLRALEAARSRQSELSA